MGWSTRVAIAAPAFHIALCYYYLFLRGFGFGSNVSEFVAAGDVFTVGLSKLLSTYLVVVGGFLLGHFWMDAEPLRVTGRTDFQLHPTLEGRSTRFLFGSIPYLAAIGIAVAVVLHGAVPLLLVAFVLIPWTAKIIARFVATNQFPKVLTTPILVLCIGLMNLTASAYSEGFRFRHRPPEFFDSQPRCINGALILFSTGDRFIASSPSGERLLLTNDCKLLLRFPATKVTLDVL